MGHPGQPLGVQPAGRLSLGPHDGGGASQRRRSRGNCIRRPHALSAGQGKGGQDEHGSLEEATADSDTHALAQVLRLYEKVFGEAAPRRESEVRLANGWLRVGHALLARGHMGNDPPSRDWRSLRLLHVQATTLEVGSRFLGLGTLGIEALLHSVLRTQYRLWMWVAGAGQVCGVWIRSPAGGAFGSRQECPGAHLGRAGRAPAGRVSRGRRH